MLKFLSKWKQRLEEHAFDKVTQALQPEAKLKYILSMIKPEAFKSLNIYSFSDARVRSFAKTIVSTNKLLKDIQLRCERDESVFTIFDDIENGDYQVHTFFVDNDGRYVQIDQEIQSLIESASAIIPFIEEEEGSFNRRKTRAIILSNIDVIAALFDSFYQIQKSLQKP